MALDREDTPDRGDGSTDRPLIDGRAIRLRVVGHAGGIPRRQVDRFTQDRIGTALRGMYEDLLSDPVPEHLAALVRRFH